MNDGTPIDHNKVFAELMKAQEQTGNKKLFISGAFYINERNYPALLSSRRQTRKNCRVAKLTPTLEKKKSAAV